MSLRKLTITEAIFPGSGMKLAITPKHTPILDIFSVIEAIYVKHPEADKFRLRERAALERREQPRPNITTYREETMQNLKRDKSLTILPANKLFWISDFMLKYLNSKLIILKKAGWLMASPMVM